MFASQCGCHNVRVIMSVSQRSGHSVRVRLYASNTRVTQWACHNVPVHILLSDRTCHNDVK